jgi:hypothetical protein
MARTGAIGRAADIRRSVTRKTPMTPSGELI